MKDAVIFLPLGMETDEPAHPYQQPAEIRRIADASPKQTGYVLFPKVTKFSTYLFRRYGKRIEAELAEGIKAGVYAMMLGLNGEEAGQVSCRLSPRMSLWRVNRYEFIADIPVEIRCETAAGEGHAEAYVTLNCCLDEDFCYFIDNVSMEKPDRALIRLDEYLVPVMSYEDLEVATREAWEQYLPEVFASHEWLNPYRLAERMGLKVAFHRVYRRKKNRGLLFWKEGMLKVVIHTDEGDTITETRIEAGTIVINDDSGDESKSRLAVYHECFHNEFHWLFFRLQEMHNDDLKAIQRVKKARNQGKELRNPLKLLEWEAREGARMLMLPTEIIQPLILSRRQELKWTKHMGELYQGIIFGVAEDLNAARYQVRQRLLQLGYWQARGALNYIPHRDGTGRYIRPFMFARESCPTSAYTFVITPAESFNLYRDNAEYRERIDSGRYIYVEGHICINDPEYVLQGRQGPYMTHWANEHVDECCLRFLNVFETDEDYEFNLGYVCSDEEYNRHYIDFESSFTSVRKTVDATEAEFDQLANTSKRMSTEVAAGTDEINEVMASGGQLGVATEHLSDFTRVMIDLGNSCEDLSADEAATTIAQFANIMGTSQSQFSNIGSTLVDLGNNFATTEKPIMEMAHRMAGAGKQVGLTEAQVLGFAAALSSVGIEAQMGGSAFSKALIKMEVASATGGDALEDFGKVAGMTGQQFKALWDSDPAAAFQSFIVGLSKLDDEGESAIAVLDEIGIKEVRLRDTMLRAVNATDLFSRAQNMATSAWKKNTALSEEANKRYATTESKLKNLKNTALLFGQQIGDDLNPTIRSLIDGAEELLQKFLSMDESQRKQIIQFAAYAAASGPVLLVLGKITKGVGTVSASFGKFATEVGKAGGGWNGFLSILGKSPAVWFAVSMLKPDEIVAYVSQYAEQQDVDISALSPEGLTAFVMAYEEATGGALTTALTPDDVTAMVTKYLQAENVDLSALTPDQIEAIVSRYAEATGCDKSQLLPSFTAYITEYKEAEGVSVPKPKTQVIITGYDYLAYRQLQNNPDLTLELPVRLGELPDGELDKLMSDGKVKFWKDGVEVPIEAVPDGTVDASTVASLDQDGTLHILITPEITGMKEAIDALSPVVDETYKLGGSWQEAWAGVMPTTTMDMVDSALGRIQSYQETLDYNWWDKFWASVGGASTNLEGLDQSMKSDFSPETVAEMSAYVAEAVSAIQQGVQVPEEDLNNLQTILDFLNGLDTTGTGAHIREGIAQGMTEAGFDSDAETVASNLETALNTALQIESPSKRVKPTGEYVAAGVGEGMSGYDFSADAQDAASGIESALQTALTGESLKSTGSTAAQGLANGMTAYPMSDTGRAVAANVRSAVQSSLNGNTLRSAGVNAMAGLRAGILAGRSGVISAMRSAAREAVNAAKKELKIKSPSQVFRDEVGVMTMRGFGVGILKESKEQAKVIRNASRFLTGEAREGSSVTNSSDNRKTYNNNVSSTIQVQQMVVRGEQDIRSLAVEIATLTRRQQRGKGLRMA